MWSLGRLSSTGSRPILDYASIRASTAWIDEINIRFDSVDKSVPGHMGCGSVIQITVEHLLVKLQLGLTIEPRRRPLGCTHTSTLHLHTVPGVSVVACPTNPSIEGISCVGLG